MPPAGRRTVHHRRGVADQAPAALQPQAEIVLTGEERLDDPAALGKQPLGIGLQHLAAKGNLEQSQRGLDIRDSGPGGRPLRPRLRSGGPVASGFDRRAKLRL